MSTIDVQCLNTRPTVQIAWSCLVIIFACTWTAVHPNVPPPHVSRSWWGLFWRRFRMMVWMILLPEMMVAWAARQWKEALEVSAEAVKRVGEHVEHSRESSAREPVSDNNPTKDVEIVIENPPFIAPPSLSGPYKWTKAHSFFLIMQGFVVPSKNQDSWIQILKDDVLDGNHPWPQVEEGAILNGAKSEIVGKLFAAIQMFWFIAQLCTRWAQHLAVTELEIMTLAYAVLCGALYFLWFKKPYDVQRPIVLPGSSEPSPKMERKDGDIPHLVFAGVWLWKVHGRIVDDRRFYDPTLPRPHHHNNLFAFSIAVVFGGIHLIPWNFTFPTPAEAMLWRYASLCVTLLPIPYGLLYLAYSGLKNVLPDDTPNWMRVCLCGSFLIPIIQLAYFAARIILFVEAFVLLRSLSPSAVQDVEWSSFLPHV
ncbi:hypothetical protein ONZ45_g7723 [Pleurotus djamor]|nr:hypothetical protein ONZ45_g7723 [Pleurotus djamor]